MRTRRSWKNQDRLWKELGGKDDKPQALSAQRTLEEIDAMWWIPQTSREMMKRDANQRRQ